MNKRQITPLAFLFACFLVLIAIGNTNRQKGNFAHVSIQASNDLSLTFLRQHVRGRAACEAAAESFATLMIANCPTCRVTRQECVHELTEEQSKLFGSEPIGYAMARLNSSVIGYQSNNRQFALATCQISEQHSPKGLAICYPPNTPRPLPQRLHESYEYLENIFLGITGLVVAIAIGLSLYLAFRWHRHRPSKSTESRTFDPRPAKIALACGDTMVMLCAFLIIAWPNNPAVGGLTSIERNTLFIHTGLIAITVIWFWLPLEHYFRRRPFWDELREIFRVIATMFLVAGAAIFIAGEESVPSAHLRLWFFCLLLVPLARIAIRRALDGLELWRMPTVIFGAGENARAAAAALADESYMGYEVIAFVDIRRSESSRQLRLATPLSSPVIECTINNDEPVERQLHQLLEQFKYPQIVIALDSLNAPDSQQLVQQLTASARNVHIIPAIRGLPLFGTQTSHFFSHEVLFLTVRNNLSRRGFQWVKRLFDIIVASILLFALAPLMAFVAWRIWRDDGLPVIFRQSRLAKDTGEFSFLKFRSMVKDADSILATWRECNSPEWRDYYSNNFKLKNDPRVLRVGSWIRASSIDELPQLINVLRGEMSLVGPRPLLARELPEYGPSIKLYRQVRPGITGLWQISGRSETTFGHRALLDEWYVQNWSLWYDIAILFKTIDVVFHKRGAT